MKTDRATAIVRVTIVQGIALNVHELGFLREMAQHCIDTMMPGRWACADLIKVLDEARIPVRELGPTYGLFEEEK
jgi:hypothetical protein